MIRTVSLMPLILLAACAEPPPMASSQPACPDTMPDVDRIACRVAAGPEPLPAGQNPSPALLRGSDGTAIIGPKPAQ
jgi:hypothetical protein